MDFKPNTASIKRENAVILVLRCCFGSPLGLSSAHRPNRPFLPHLVSGNCCDWAENLEWAGLRKKPPPPPGQRDGELEGQNKSGPHKSKCCEQLKNDVHGWKSVCCKKMIVAIVLGL